MPEDSTEHTDAAETDQNDNQAAPDTGEPDWKAEVEKWKTQARKHEDRAKANASAAKELEALKQASMSEVEKATAQAKIEGRTEAAKEFGSKLAKAELRAAAAGRLSESQVATLVENVNLVSFLTDEGEVDQKRVAQFIEGIAPAEQQDRNRGFPDLGQGARGATNGAGDMNSLIRRQLGR